MFDTPRTAVSLMRSAAWAVMEAGLQLAEPERTFLQVPYHYACTAPAVGAMAAAAAGRLEEGEALLARASVACTLGVMDEPPDALDRVRAALAAGIAAIAAFRL